MLYDSQFIKIIRLQDLFGTPCGEGEILHYFDKAPDDDCCAKAYNSTSDIQQLCSPELTTELWDAVLKSEELCNKDPLYYPSFPSRPLDKLIERVKQHVEHHLEHGRANSNFHKVFAAVLLRQLHEGDIIQFSGWAVNQADKEPHYLLIPDTKEKRPHYNGVLTHMTVQLKVTGEPKVEPSAAQPSKDDSQSSSCKKVVVQLEFSGCSLYGKSK